MGEVLRRIAANMAGRIHGPLSFRFILQPLTAIFFAYRDGIRDARSGEPAYFWSLLDDPLDRHGRIRAGWKAVSRVFVLGVLMDVIYQWLVFRHVYPGEVLITATGLAIVPYVLVRGPINRIMQHRTGGERIGHPRNRT